MRPSSFLVVPAFIAILVPAASQAQTVRGQVIDEATAASVRDVAVTLLDSAGVALAEQTTQADGSFAFTAPVAGKYRLRFQVPG